MHDASDRQAIAHAITTAQYVGHGA
jgi:hypothetical protein